MIVNFCTFRVGALKAAQQHKNAKASQMYWYLLLIGAPGAAQYIPGIRPLSLAKPH